jgi:hypothetical protein
LNITPQDVVCIAHQQVSETSLPSLTDSSSNGSL